MKPPARASFTASFPAAFLAALGLWLVACAPPAAAADPIASVAPLYDRYKAAEPAAVDLREEAPWTSNLKTLLDRALALSEESDEPNPVVDFDPIIDAQDCEITDVHVTLAAPPAGGRATVIARFKNFGEQKELTYDMLLEEGQWRVDNISGPNWSLRGMLAELDISTDVH